MTHRCCVTMTVTATMTATADVSVMTTAIAAEDKQNLLKTSFFMDGVFSIVRQKI
ncbi:MAG: hypothetical protein SOZ28_05300 [Clostridia bacterium]|nr:hypothetical protein [Clostridia bacterium]